MEDLKTYKDWELVQNINNSHEKIDKIFRGIAEKYVSDFKSDPRYNGIVEALVAAFKKNVFKKYAENCSDKTESVSIKDFIKNCYTIKLSNNELVFIEKSLNRANSANINNFFHYQIELCNERSGYDSTAKLNMDDKTLECIAPSPNNKNEQNDDSDLVKRFIDFQNELYKRIISATRSLLKKYTEHYISNENELINNIYLAVRTGFEKREYEKGKFASIKTNTLRSMLK